MTEIPEHLLARAEKRAAEQVEQAVLDALGDTSDLKTFAGRLLRVAAAMHLAAHGVTECAYGDDVAHTMGDFREAASDAMAVILFSKAPQ